MVVEVVQEMVEESRGRASLLPDEPAEPVDSNGLSEALRGGGVSVIAEVKPSSPTKDFPPMDPAEAALGMERGGAAAVSVLTEPLHFGGSPEDLRKVRGAVDLPVLRKDFIVDEKQLHETARLGADAVLLIARFLEDLDEFVSSSRELGLEPLVEVHDGGELDRALATDAEVIGVNSRDLGTLEVDLSASERLIPSIEGALAVAESGIRTGADLGRMRDAGADAVLIGSAIMEGDVARTTERFAGAV